MTLTATDLFCGAGGSSLGAEMAGVELVMASNHWPKAIEVHNANFPTARHDCADISQVHPARYPKTDILLASPECTNHSNAKGVSRKAQNPDLWDIGDPAAIKSRATMWDVHRFVEHHQYDAVIVENVVDAGRWVYWPSWWQAWSDAGYDARVVSLNSAHTGAVHQWRDRIYIVATRKGVRPVDLEMRPPCWCPACEQVVAGRQAFKKLGQGIGKWRAQYDYRCPECHGVVDPPAPPAADVIDWALPAERIGDRKKPLAPNTMERIRRGLAKWGPHLLAGQGNTWDGVNTGTNYLRAWSLNDPTPTQACRFQHAIAHPPAFLDVLRTNAEGLSVDGPTATITSGGQHHALVMAPQSGGQALPVRMPVPSQTATIPPHLIVQYHSGAEARPDALPHGTMTTRDRAAVVSAKTDVEDCHYRMLDTHEVKAAMAFPETYVATGTKTDLVKLWGNAVTPPVMQVLAERVREALVA